MLDFNLASLYGVTTFNLNKAVARNRSQLPPDFMLSIPAREAERLIFQSGISKTGRGGRRKPVLAFTQEGVAMLSSVLRSERAVLVNIEIMRAFVRLRSLLAAHAELARRLDKLEENYDERRRHTRQSALHVTEGRH
ncbi:MAG: ORF6N domain-containing protein [Vicinamibacteria bacterium]|nr:ORF6N domain-containing protein [Vicinamibacteria bacterium]